jgi:ATP-binding cassette subfamily F protein 1
MRVSLAKALFLEPDLLLLDEPTNHLDLDAVLWLDDYLSSYPKTLLVVSHDADFLDSACTDIVHLENRKLEQYKGGYTEFRRAHAQRVKDREKEFKKQQEDKNKGKKRHPDEIIEKPKDYIVKFHFLPPVRDDEMSGISIHDVNFSYNGKKPWLLRDLNFRIDTSTKVTVVGKNGAGKSTLLSLIAKVHEPCEGDVSHSRRLQVGRYSQHFDEIAPYLSMTAVEFLTSPELRRFGAGTENPELAHKCLGQFGLPSHAHSRPMKELSGGQKARVCFASITCRKPEILILDEPTNHWILRVLRL